MPLGRGCAGRTPAAPSGRGARRLAELQRHGVPSADPPLMRSTTRYGITWRGIKRPNDREMGIAGGELIVLDLETHEVLGVRRGYAFYRGSWEITALCPHFGYFGGFDKATAFTAWFTMKVARPPRWKEWFEANEKTRRIRTDEVGPVIKQAAPAQLARVAAWRADAPRSRLLSQTGPRGAASSDQSHPARLRRDPVERDGSFAAGRSSRPLDKAVGEIRCPRSKRAERLPDGRRALHHDLLGAQQCLACTADFATPEATGSGQHPRSSTTTTSGTKPGVSASRRTVRRYRVTQVLPSFAKTLTVSA